MLRYDVTLMSDEQTSSFVQTAEDGFRKQVLFVAEEIAAAGNVRFMALSGPTCSGKTTTSHILKEAFLRHGITVKTVSIDDFYRDRAELDKEKNPDYESIRSINLPLFEFCVDQIVNGETTKLPKFDFHAGKCVEWEDYAPQPQEIVLFEGIQALYPEISAVIPQDLCRSVSIGVKEDVEVNGAIFTGREVRFLRRLVRDYLFRGASVARTLELWGGVVANEDKNILPYEKSAQFSINSFLAYELNVIKPFLLDLLPFDRTNPEEKKLFDYLQEKFKKIPVIDRGFVPTDSVFREFIG